VGLAAKVDLRWPVLGVMGDMEAWVEVVRAQNILAHALLVNKGLKGLLAFLVVPVSGAVTAALALQSVVVFITPGYST
jgi:hypothetical protein